MAETRSIWSWMARTGIGLFAAAIFGIIGLYVFIQSQMGLDFLASRIGQALSDKPMTIRITGMKGSVMSSFSIAKITVADSEGVYASIHDTTIDWRPWALFNQAIDLETLSIARISVSRLPQTETTSQPEPVSAFAPGLHIRARKITVAEAEIAQPVLGESQRLSATATVLLNKDLSDAALDVFLQRIDGGKGTAKIKLDYAARPARFMAQIRIEEPAGGVLARLAGLPSGHRLFVDLTGIGPPDNWRGDLKIEAGPALAANSTVSLALRDASIGVSIEGTSKIGSLLSPDLQPLVTPSVRFQADAEFVPPQGLFVRRFTAESNLLELSGTGRYQSAEDQISAAITVSLRDHPSVATLLPDLAISRAEFGVKLDGRVEAPRVSVSFQTDRVGGGLMQIAAMQGSFALNPVSATTFDVEGEVKAEGVKTGERIPAGIFGTSLDVTASGKLSRDGAISGVTLTAASGPTKAELSGQFYSGGRGDGAYSLRLDEIETLARSVGLTLKGSFDAKGKIRVDVPAGTVQASTEGSFADLSTSSPELTSVLGKRILFTGEFDRQDGKPLKFVGIKIDPAIGRLTADGTLDTATGGLSARLGFAGPDMKVLSKLAGKPISGRATISAVIDGPINAPTADGQIGVADLQIDETAVGSFGVAYTARLDGAMVKTRLRLDGTLGEKKLNGSMNGNFRNGAVDLTNIDVSLGKNRLGGALGFDPAGPALSSALKATLNDFNDLPGVSEFGLSGAGEISAASHVGGNNAIDVTAVARDIRVGGSAAGGAEIEKATAQFRLNEPFGLPKVRGETNLENFRVAGLRRGKATLKISGNQSQIDWSTNASADGTYPISLATNGSISLSPAQSRLSIQKLEGKFAGQDISLGAPFGMAWQASGQKREWRVEPVDFSVAGGRFRLAGSMTNGVLDADGQFDNLPLQLASLIDPKYQMDGSVAGNLRASGTPQAPALAMTVTASDIRPPDVNKEEFAGFNLVVDARQDSETASATGTLTGPVETSAKISLATQPLVSLSPILFSPKSDLPITGELSANGRLGLIDRLVGLGEDRIAGLVRAQAKITGTLGKPAINGEVRLSDGAYEGAMTGTVLRKIDGHVVFSGDSARLVSLTADDGESGRLSGTGVVQFTDAGASSDKLEIKLDHFTALRHPLVDAEVTGEATLSGPLGAPRVSGRMNVEKGEIRIPDQLPQQIVELDVVEIHGPTANAVIAKEPSLAKTFPISLDMTINFPNRTFVRGRGLDSEWKGDLVVSGTSAAPIINGKLQAVRGTFAFAGKTFVVKSGSVFFPKSAAEPEIEAVAEAKLKDLVARVEISGSVSQPTIKISSDPALPQEDVLAHILFGRTTGQLSPIQAAQLAQTAATLSGKGGAGIVDKIRQALGVDVLNVESGEGDSRGASLKAGKYLTEEIFLSVTQGTKPGTQKLGVEVQVLPNITVESDVSGTADSNIGINWKWNY